MTIEADNRRQYIRRSMVACLSRVTGISNLTIGEITNDSSQFPRGSHRLGSEDFLPVQTESRRRGEHGIAHLLMKVEFEGSPNGVIDDDADAVVQAFEIAVKTFKAPEPYVDTYNTVQIDDIDRAAVIINLNRGQNTGEIYLPLMVMYTQWWKR